MDLRAMQVKKTQQIELGEEKLYKAYNFQNKKRVVDLLMGIDGGSTQTRVIILANNDLDINTQYIIPSNNVLLNDDREIKPKSEELVDRLDSFIVNEKQSKEAKIGRDRIVRATKMLDTGLSPTSISSTMQKIDEPIFYLNIVDSIGYALMQKYEDEIPTEVNLVAGIALPPDDMSSTRNMNIFRQNIVGSYTWTHKDSQVKIKINILDVELATEPEAFVMAYYASTGKETPETVLCINTGGRSTGVAVLRNSKIVDSASLTFAYGGNQFRSELGNIYVNRCGGRVPTDDLLGNAIKSGKLKSGNSTIDIVEDITKACDVYAERLFMDTVKNVCDRAGMPLYSINEIVMCGGLARGGSYDISVADYLGDRFEARTPDTEYTVVEENLIPFGLAFIAFNRHGDLIGDEIEEDVEVDELEEV